MNPPKRSYHTITRNLFLGILGLIILFSLYVNFQEPFSDSSEPVDFSSLLPGKLVYSEALQPYGLGADSLATVMEGEHWKKEKFVHLRINNGPGDFSGIAFTMHHALPQNASVVIRWRGHGTAARVLLDITDGTATDAVAETGENYYVYLSSPSSDWTTITVPLSDFQRNPYQKAGAPNDRTFDTEAIRGISFTFFPGTRLNADIADVQFVWTSERPVFAVVTILLWVLGFVLWYRMQPRYVREGKDWEVRSRTIGVRVVYTLLATTILLTVVDSRVTFFHSPLVLVHAFFFILLLYDEFAKKPLSTDVPWAFRYLGVLLIAWFFDLSGSAWQLALLLCIAYVPLVLQPSRVAFLSAPALIAFAFGLHPGLNLSRMFFPGILVIGGTTILAWLVRLFLYHRQADFETHYMRLLYEDILENTSEAVYILTREGNIQSANRGFATLLALPVTEIIGREVHTFVHESDREFIQQHRQPAEGQNSTTYDIRFVNSDGEVRAALVREVPLYNDHVLIGYQAIATDITHRKNAEEEREQLVKELRGALTQVKTLKGLIPICSHCKKIRDDQGYWNLLEVYIQTHADVQFSHGICPECASTYYPEYFRK